MAGRVEALPTSPNKRTFTTEELLVVTLRPDQVVRHKRTANLYRIITIEHLHKVDNEWISSVCYESLAETTTPTFSRSIPQFKEMFEDA